MADGLSGDDRPVRSFDLEDDPDVADRLFERCDELREESAVFYSETPGFWAFTRMERVRNALRDAALFSNDATMVWKKNRTTRLPFRVIPAQLNPPEHTTLSRLLHRLLSASAVAHLEPVMRSHARRILDDLEGRASCDFMADYARRLPTRVFIELLGLPGERTAEFVELADRFHRGSAETDPDGAEVRRTVTLIADVLQQCIEMRRRDPRDDLITKLVHAQVEGRSLSSTELRDLGLQLFGAGLDTVAGALGFFVLHCATHPQDRARIVADPSILPAAIEESLRLYSQVSPSRMVTRDIEVDGFGLRAGEFVLLPLACANRDPEAFDDAGSFRLDRPTNRHVAFGTGPHRCVGAPLARLELRVALEEWHARHPDYEVPDGAAVRRYATGVAGLATLPLTLLR